MIVVWSKIDLHSWIIIFDLRGTQKQIRQKSKQEKKPHLKISSSVLNKKYFLAFWLREIDFFTLVILEINLFFSPRYISQIILYVLPYILKNHVISVK